MIGLIVARSKNNVIGKNGNIPWKIKGEQKQFRELTTGNVVIMGRKSYEEIGHPLPNRMNIVVSTTTEYQGDNLVSVKSLEDALLLAKGRDVYISGGYGLFKEALQIVDKMYITEVDLNIEDGDTFFPEFAIKFMSEFRRRPFTVFERVNRQLERAYLDRIDAWQVRRYKQLVGEIINILRGFPENELNRQLEDLYLMGYELQRNAFFTKNDTTNHTEEE